jgi:hypothetical protein
VNWVSGQRRQRACQDSQKDIVLSVYTHLLERLFLQRINGHIDDLFAPALKLKQKLPKPFLERESDTNREARSNSKRWRHIVKSVTSAKHLSRLLQLHGQAAKEAAGYLSYKSTPRVISTTISVLKWGAR